MARTRFLFLAVFEGLWEDGVDPAPLKAIVAKRFDHFVGKCPICMPVSHAFAVYAYSSDTDVYPSRGKGLSQDLSDDLKSPDRPKRLRAIQTLVDRYVERRFERSKMTDEEKNNMQNLLLMGKKLGSSVKDQKFGESCPSCEGATKGK